MATQAYPTGIAGLVSDHQNKENIAINQAKFFGFPGHEKLFAPYCSLLSTQKHCHFF